MRRRFTQLVLTCGGLMAGWVASAGAEIPPLPPPPVTVPSVSVPTVTLPAVTTPAAPQPLPPPPPKPKVTLPAGGSSLPVVVGTGPGSGGEASRAGPNPDGGAQTTGGTTTSEATRPTSEHRPHSARDWITTRGPKNQRRTTLVFVLGRPVVVEFVVVQLAPQCRRIGRFRVRGHEGVNRIRVGRRIGRRALAPGTYRFVARTVPRGRKVADRRLVVVPDASRRTIRAARHANTCSRGASSSNRSTSTTIGPANTAPAGAAGPRAGPTKVVRPPGPRGVRGVRFANVALSPPDGVPRALYFVLGLAIALLGAAAALPKAAPTHTAAPLVAGASGAGILLGLTVAYAFP